MERLIFTLLLLCAFNILSVGQSRMIVDKSPEQAYFEGYGKVITSLSQVPKNIKDSAEFALNSFLGDFRLKTMFENGQIINLEAYHKFKDNGSPNLSIPKYELIFVLRDTSVGIENYGIEVRLTASGKLFKLNWPRTGYTKKSIFFTLDSVKNTVLKRAKELNFDRKNYKVSFAYDYDKQKFFWTFLFLKSKTGMTTRYNSITINWVNLSDIDISEENKVVVY